MALPGSGAFTWGDIQTQFGGSNPIAINEYYRGGSYVPPTTLNAAVPTSGAITADNFHGAGVDVDMDTSYTTADNSSVTSTSTIAINNDATASLTGSGDVTSFSDTWVPTSTAPGNWYEVKAHVTAGALTSGSAVDTWLDLNTSRSWTLQATASGADASASCTVEIAIRCKATGTLLDTTTVYMSVYAVYVKGG